MATAFDTTLTNLGINRTTTSAKATASGSAQLGQSDFLKLMTAQLQNQDPFAPVDNTQMVAQMAQFSSVAGISDINSTLKAIQDKLSASSPGDALAYVGHTVLTEGATAYGRASGGLAGAVELDAAAGNVVVSISDANGQTLRTLALGSQPAGTISYDWDGTTAAGDDAGAGPFTVSVAAASQGAKVAARGLVWAPVAAVSLPASGPAVLTLPGLGPVPVTAVRQVG